MNYPNKIICYFSSSYLRNNATGLILFFFGVFIVGATSFILFLFRSCREDESKCNKIEDMLIWTKEQFLYGYFIRLYQVTMVKNFLSTTLLLSSYRTSSFIDLFIGIPYLIVWLLGFPVYLFITLRINQINLMSEKLIKSYGSLYLNNRGISKDVYALLLHLRLALVPVISVLATDFPNTQLTLLSILFFINLIFVSFFMPFIKRNSVFTEALSEGIIMFFLAGTIVFETLFPARKTDFYVRLSFTAVLFGILIIRSVVSVVNMIYRIKDIILFERKYKKAKKNSEYRHAQNCLKNSDLPEGLIKFNSRRNPRMGEDSGRNLNDQTGLENDSENDNKVNISHHSIIHNSHGNDSKGSQLEDDIYSQHLSKNIIVTNQSKFSQLLRLTTTVAAANKISEISKNELREDSEVISEDAKKIIEANKNELKENSVSEMDIVEKKDISKMNPEVSNNLCSFNEKNKSKSINIKKFDKNINNENNDLAILKNKENDSLKTEKKLKMNYKNVQTNEKLELNNDQENNDVRSNLSNNSKNKSYHNQKQKDLIDNKSSENNQNNQNKIDINQIKSEEINSISMYNKNNKKIKSSGISLISNKSKDSKSKKQLKNNNVEKKNRRNFR